MANRTETATRAVVEEANEWLVRLQDRDVGARQEAAFNEWLCRSPLHVREYLRAEAVWSAMEDVNSGGDVDALLSTDTANVVPIDSAMRPVSQSTARPAAGFWRISSVAASVVALAATLIWYSVQPDTLRYETGLGEQRHLILEDGSVIDMNTQSQIEVRFSDSERHIELLEGEALFTVAKDAARPFIVESDLATVRALGTQFNVYRLSDQVLVTVIEGRVSVKNTPAIGNLATGADNIELTAGDQAEVVAQVPIQRTSANTEHAVAWRERRLIFENRPLSEVAEEFNRYNRRQLLVRGPALRAELVNAVFDADQPEALVRFLTQSASVEVVSEGDRLLVIQLRE